MEDHLLSKLTTWPQALSAQLHRLLKSNNWVSTKRPCKTNIIIGSFGVYCRCTLKYGYIISPEFTDKTAHIHRIKVAEFLDPCISSIVHMGVSIENSSTLVFFGFDYGFLFAGCSFNGRRMLLDLYIQGVSNLSGSQQPDNFHPPGSPAPSLWAQLDMAQAMKVELPPGDRATRRPGWPMDYRMKEDRKKGHRNGDEFWICSIWGHQQTLRI